MINCTFKIKPLESEINEALLFLQDDDKLETPFPTLITQEFGLPHPAYIYKRKNELKKKIILQYATPLNKSQSINIKHQIGIFKKYWLKNQDKINECFKTLFDNSIDLNIDYIVNITFAKSFIYDFTKNEFNISYKLTKQYFLQECIYNIATRLYLEYFKTKNYLDATLKSEDNAKLQRLLAQIIVNISFRGGIFKEFKIKYPLDTYLSKIYIDKMEILNYAFLIFNEKPYNEFIDAVYQTILNNKNYMLEKMRNI